MPPERVCGVCGESWPLHEDYFYRSKKEVYGFSYWCKECQKARSRKSSRDNAARKMVNRSTEEEEDRLLVALEKEARQRTSSAYKLIDNLCPGQEVIIKKGRRSHKAIVELINRFKTMAFLQCKKGREAVHVADLVSGKIEVLGVAQQ